MNKFLKKINKKKIKKILLVVLDFMGQVLIFSQMTMMLDVLADYLDLQGMKFCRLDGRMGLDERAKYMDIFKNDASVPVFLVSTRAGGLGINLTSADTVIIYDSDWVTSFKRLSIYILIFSIMYSFTTKNLNS